MKKHVCKFCTLVLTCPNKTSMEKTIEQHEERCKALKHWGDFMIDELKNSGIECDNCGYMLLVLLDKVFCNNPSCSDYRKQVKPNDA